MFAIKKESELQNMDYDKPKKSPGSPTDPTSVHSCHTNLVRYYILEVYS